MGLLLSYISSLLPQWEDSGMMQSYMRTLAVVSMLLETFKVTSHHIVVVYKL